MYAIQVTLSDKITFVSLVTRKKEKYFGLTTELFNAKFYKSRKGAEKARDKFQAENGACQNVENFSVREVTEQDIEQSRVDDVNYYFNLELNSLKNKYLKSLDVLTLMKYRLASMLIDLKQGDLAIYCKYTTTGWKCEPIEIEEVKYSAFKVKGTYYRRFYGIPEMKCLPIHGISERVYPNDDRIVNYFTQFGIYDLL